MCPKNVTINMKHIYESLWKSRYYGETTPASTALPDSKVSGTYSKLAWQRSSLPLPRKCATDVVSQWFLPIATGMVAPSGLCRRYGSVNLGSGRGYDLEGQATLNQTGRGCPAVTQALDCHHLFVSRCQTIADVCCFVRRAGTDGR